MFGSDLGSPDWKSVPYAESWFLKLTICGAKFDHMVVRKFVTDVFIFQMALVSLNSDYRFRRYHRNCVAVPFRKVVCRNGLYSFDLFRGRIPSSVCSESCRKFSVDIQDVFTY